MKKLKKLLPTILLGLVFAAGICILAYPTFSSWWNGRVQSRVAALYSDAAAALTEEDTSGYLEAARQYNEAVRAMGSAAALSRPESIPGYEETLNVTGNGVMGTITIDKIHVNLPIFHGTSAGVLSAGAGHLEGSSLPIGGEGTHSVVSAHRGLPSAKLFTNLDQVGEGDIFVLHVLGEDLYYEVDQIVTVLPTQMEELFIHEGEDLCTLMTCTPYGINTHRLLVRGRRIFPTAEEIAEMEAAAPVTGRDRGIGTVAAILAAAVVLVLLLSEICVRVLRRKRRRNRNEDNSKK